MDKIQMMSESKEYDDNDDNDDMTYDALVKICKTHPDLYDYPEINENLFLQYNGFQHINGLEKFEQLKCLWLQNNLIEDISHGLSTCTQLTQLYLENNKISKICGLETLVNLTDLVLSGNNISRIEGISSLKQLKNLNLSNNIISSGLDKLLDLPLLSCLDLSKNQIKLDDKYSITTDDDNNNNNVDIIGVLKRIPELRVLYLKNNPLVNSIKSYRRHIITEIKTLTFLDDRRVQVIERIAAEAYKRGGSEAERKARVEFTDKERKLQLEKYTTWQKGRHLVSTEEANREDFGTIRTEIDDNENEKKEETKEEEEEEEVIDTKEEVVVNNNKNKETSTSSSTNMKKKHDFIWNPKLDGTLFQLCHEEIFDFDLVCMKLKKLNIFIELCGNDNDDMCELTSKDCRTRYAYLDSIGYSDDDDDDDESHLDQMD